MHKVVAYLIIITAGISFLYFGANPILPSYAPVDCNPAIMSLVRCQAQANPLNYMFPIGLGIVGAAIYVYGGRLEGDE